MAGAIVMVIVLVIVIPVLVLLSGAVASAILGGALKADRDRDNRTDDGEPNEFLVLAESNPYDTQIDQRDLPKE